MNKDGAEKVAAEIKGLALVGDVWKSAGQGAIARRRPPTARSACW